MWLNLIAARDKVTGNILLKNEHNRNKLFVFLVRTRQGIYKAILLHGVVQCFWFHGAVEKFANILYTLPSIWK